MKTRQRTYEVTITEVRTYVVAADGTSKFAAEQDAIERFHRLRKSGELPPYRVGKPKAGSVVLLK